MRIVRKPRFVLSVTNRRDADHSMEGTGTLLNETKPIRETRETIPYRNRRLEAFSGGGAECARRILPRSSPLTFQDHSPDAPGRAGA